MAGLDVKPILRAVAARFNQVLKERSISADNLERSALGRRQIRGDANGFERQALLGFFVEAKRAGAARQRGEQIHALDDPPKQRDIAIKMPRGVPDDHIQLRATAAVCGIITARSNHPVTMRQPNLAALRIAGDGKASAKPNLRRINIAVGQASEWEFRIKRALEL